VTWYTLRARVFSQSQGPAPTDTYVNAKIQVWLNVVAFKWNNNFILYRRVPSLV